MIYGLFAAYFRDATGQSTSVKGIRLNICDINWRPPQAIQAKKMLTDTVTVIQSEKVKTVQIDGKFFWLIFCFCQQTHKTLFGFFFSFFSFVQIKHS